MSNLRLFIRLARPLFLLGGILLYALGVGIAHYLGTPLDWKVYLLGQVWGTTLQLGTQFLNEYFDVEGDAHNPNRTPLTGGSNALGEGEGKLPRPVALWSALACLAVTASFTVLLIETGHLTPSVLLLMVLILFGAVFYAVPPVRLESTGYGELTTSILVATLVPAFAFLLQNDTLHRLLPMTTFPLTTLCLAMLLAFDLPDYGTDLKYGKRNLMVRVGWQAGMTLHNLLILISYLLLALAILLGLPLAVAWPGFLTLPLGLFEIWFMNRIGAGAKPNWFALTLSAFALFGLTAYLLTFAFWTR